MYCNRFSTILYIISDNSLITLIKEWYDHEILVCKNILESFDLICVVFPQCSIYYTSNTSTEEEHQVFFRSVVNFPDNYQHYCTQFPL